jgi:superfamily I DNA/RNA helicase
MTRAPQALNIARLNSRQREAVVHGDGPLLVLAGAGSGKTSTMAYRIAHLIAERNVPARAILGLSFTNKAASELKDRVRKLVAQVSGPRASHGLIISTFHSLCVRVLRAHADAIGFQKDFTIVDESDRRDILKQIFRNLKVDDRKFDLDSILFQIGQAKNRLLGQEEAEAFLLESARLSSDYAAAAAASYSHYQRQLKLLNAMDFDDLIFHTVGLLEQNAAVREQYNWLFRYILVDEYQDTNATQFRLLRLLTERHQNLCVVGDDDQSIYSWRGADSTHILEFKNQFPAAKLITLDQNYRSTSTILEAANKVISNNRVRHPKTLWSDRGQGSAIHEFILEDDRDESEFVAQQILERHQKGGAAWKDFAILYRSNAQSRVFEESLRKYRVPYKIVGGMSFLDRKEIKDTLSYWRLVVNPKDDASMRRVINWPSRGIGKTAIEALSTDAFARGEALSETLVRAELIAPRAASGAAALAELLRGLRRELESVSTLEGFAHWGKSSLEKIGIKRALDEETEDPVQLQRRWESVEELANALGQVPREELAEGGVSALREFLSRLALEAQAQEDEGKDRKDKDRDENQVTLLTLHGAKGLEYLIVHLVGMEDGFLPHKRTLEEAQDLSEERRLCYVGITRARDTLILTRARNRIRFGKPVPRYRSRFLMEVPTELIVIEDRSSGPVAGVNDPGESTQARDAHEVRVKSFLANIRGALGDKGAQRPR